MKNIITALICLFILSGCALIKVPPKADNGNVIPPYNQLKDIGEKTVPEIDYSQLDDYPPAKSFIDNSTNTEFACFQKPDFIELMKLREMCYANEDILQKNNELMTSTIAERNEIYKIALNYEKKANLEHEKVELKDRDIQTIKRKNFIARWTERGIFAIVLYLVAN